MDIGFLHQGAEEALHGIELILVIHALIPLDAHIALHRLPQAQDAAAIGGRHLEAPIGNGPATEIDPPAGRRTCGIGKIVGIDDMPGSGMFLPGLRLGLLPPGLLHDSKLFCLFARMRLVIGSLQGVDLLPALLQDQRTSDEHPEDDDCHGAQERHPESTQHDLSSALRCCCSPRLLCKSSRGQGLSRFGQDRIVSP